jgi:hypothetical protein
MAEPRRFSDQPAITEVVADTQTIAVRRILPDWLLIKSELRHLDLISEHLALELRAYVLERVHEEQPIAVPSSWWQHFKADCFPEFLLRRWPIRYDTPTYQRIVHMCPHATEDWAKHRDKHVLFLLFGPAGERP